MDFRTCAICGGPLEGLEAEQQVVEHRRLSPAEGAALQRDVPSDLAEDEVCADCLRTYRSQIGMRRPPERDV